MIKRETSLNQFLAEHTAAIVKRRAGRKPKQGADRYESGRLKAEGRPAVKEKVKETAVEARQRVFGISAKDADSQEGGSAIGRLWLIDAFGDRKTQGRDALQAAEEFGKRRRAFEQAIDVRSLKTSTNYADGAGGDPFPNGDDEDYVNRCNDARRRYSEIRRVILECGDALAMSALEMVIIDDSMPRDEKTMGSLRIGLNAIHRLLRYEKKVA
jgi:hypothetical protein